MSPYLGEIELFFVGTGLLFALRPSAAARYSYSNPSNQRLVRIVAAPLLVVIGMLIFLGITI